ncbi:MAG: YegS/Rv2252/BmrU family lipid kinase [Kiloniellales bacterium]|nr:YegS/Rv2252/BmrU family lipid kinase [Kiloniellales bacterium]
MTMRSMRLILNGKKAGALPLRQAIEEVRAEGVAIDVEVTWEAGDAARHAARALRDRVDVIVAGGGDGTVNEIVNGIFAETESPEAAMAVLPLGSANDFARGCGIGVDDPLAALRLAATKEPTPIDVGRIDERLFLNALVAGFGADVTFQTSERMKSAMRGAAYGLTGFLMALKGDILYRSSARSDGGREWKDDVMIMGAACNGVQAGGVRLAPMARLNDGLLDVVTLNDFPLRELSKVIEDIELIQEEEAKPRYIEYHKVQWIEVEAEHDLPLSPDGEKMHRQEFRVEALKRRLPFILPEGAPLVTD